MSGAEIISKLASQGVQVGEINQTAVTEFMATVPVETPLAQRQAAAQKMLAATERSTYALPKPKVGNLATQAAIADALVG